MRRSDTAVPVDAECSLSLGDDVQRSLLKGEQCRSGSEKCSHVWSNDSHSQCWDTKNKIKRELQECFFMLLSRLWEDEKEMLYLNSFFSY